MKSTKKAVATTPPSTPGSLDVQRLLRSLHAMSVPALRGRYEQVFGEPARSNNKACLVRRIVWREQALREGDLSERARRRAAELARDADLRVRPPKDLLACPEGGTTVTVAMAASTDPRLPAPGTLLRRQYKGRTHTVLVLENGFEYAGEFFRSLSAVANRVTGGHWNGCAFFGLKTPLARGGKEGGR